MQQSVEKSLLLCRVVFCRILAGGSCGIIGAVFELFAETLDGPVVCILFFLCILILRDVLVEDLHQEEGVGKGQCGEAQQEICQDPGILRCTAERVGHYFLKRWF